MIKFKKAIAILSALFLAVGLTSCSEAVKTQLNSGKILQEYGENVYNALIEHDNEALKSLFCEEHQNNYDLDADIEAMYEFLGENIQGYENIRCATHGESVRDGETVRLTGYADLNGLKTDKDTFDITVNVMLIYKDNSSYVGVQTINILNSKYDPFATDEASNIRKIGNILEGW